MLARRHVQDLGSHFLALGLSLCLFAPFADAQSSSRALAQLENPKVLVMRAKW